MEGAQPAEIILAQEQAVKNRGVGVVQEIKTAFDVGKVTEGTLIVTNLRLIFAHSSERREDLLIGETTPLMPEARVRISYADVDDLQSIKLDPTNFEVPLSSIVSVKGHKGPLSPRLEVHWNDADKVKATEFVQQITGGSRRKNLNDWALVIERLKSGQQKLAILPSSLPDKDTLEGRIFQILGDMQEKGLLTIESEVEERFNLNLDPDQVEDACESLVARGLIRKTSNPGEDPFYRRASPLGEDDLGS